MNAEPEDGASPEPEEAAPAKKAKKRRASVDPSDKVRAKRPKNGIMPERLRITVAGEGVIEPAAQAPQEASDAFPLVIPERGAGRQLVVPSLPSSTQLEVALAQATTLEELVNFDKMITVLKAAAEQFRVEVVESIRVATVDLVTRRRIGTILLQVETRGGDRAKCHDDTLLEKLLRELGKGKVKRCRAIARIAEPHFADYLKVMTDQREVPTEAGVFRHARKATKASGKVPAKPRKAKQPKAESAAPELSRELLDAVQRCMSNIDVCIGDARVKCGKQLNADTADTKQIRGKVFVSECREPGECLPKLVKLRLAGAVEEALVILPFEPGAAWFRAVAQGEWHCCFPTGKGALVAYLGPKTRGFVVTFDQVGTVVRGCAGAEPAP